MGRTQTSNRGVVYPITQEVITLATYQLTINGVVTYHNYESMVEAIAFMKATGKAGTIKKVESKPVNNTKVTVTCGYGTQTHKWETTKDQAVKFKNFCPEHRSK